jgi:hypothetical protein
MEMEPRMSFEPSLHLGMLVSSVIVDDQVQLSPDRGLAVDLIEEADEFLMLVARHTLPDDPALQLVECGEQRRCAVALVDAMGRAAGACDLGAAMQPKGAPCDSRTT